MKAGLPEAGQLQRVELDSGHTYTFHRGKAALTGYLKVTDITFKVNHAGTEVTNVGEKDAKVKRTRS